MSGGGAAAKRVAAVCVAISIKIAFLRYSATAAQKFMVLNHWMQNLPMPSNPGGCFGDIERILLRVVPN